MRDHFIKQLFTIAKSDPRIMLLTGDLGFGVLDEFERALPDQYINVGVAEQNMIGIATGLSLEGRIVFTYSIGNFGTFRCFEQIRNDACYHNANVKVVCVGAGFSYGSLGMSHHATEDISVFRALPDLTICSPGDLWEAQCCAQVMVETPGTCYLRLDKSSAGYTQRDGENFVLGKARLLKKGGNVAILSTGGILDEVLKAAERLEAEGLSTSVLHFHTIKPLDVESLARISQSATLIVTVEEHTVEGGFGSAIAEHLLEECQFRGRFYRIGLRSGFSSIVGSQAYLRHYYHVDADAIVSKISSLLLNADVSLSL